MEVFLADTALFTNSVAGTPAWVLVGLSVMAALYLTIRPKKRDPLASQPFRTSLAQQKSLERDMQNVVVELAEMTRQMSAQLETRAAKLDALIREADAKLAELRGAVDRPALDCASSADPELIVSSRFARPTMRLAKHVGENPHSEDRWAEVYRLSEQGLTLGQIAQQLRRPTGEVELILALRPKVAPRNATIGGDSEALPAIAEA